MARAWKTTRLTLRDVVEFWPDVAEDKHTHVMSVEVVCERVDDVDFLPGQRWS